jgi:Fis family transcriptional regulator
MPNPDETDNAEPLSHYVGNSLDRYLESLNGGAPPTDMYRMVLEQVEKPLLARVLEYNRGNQSKTAAMLGINRGTLRKKLRSYDLDG